MGPGTAPVPISPRRPQMLRGEIINKKGVHQTGGGGQKKKFPTTKRHARRTKGERPSWETRKF